MNNVEFMYLCIYLPFSVTPRSYNRSVCFKIDEQLAVPRNNCILTQILPSILYKADVEQGDDGGSVE